MSYSSDPDDASGFLNIFDFRFLVRHVRLLKGIALILLLLAGAGLAACDIMPGLRDDAPQPAPDSLRFSYSPLNENAQGKAEKQPPSPYYCLTSVRTPDGPHRYRYQKVYLLYPEPLLEDAPDRVMHQTYRLHAQANSGGNESERPIQRLARCRLPATPQAAGMLHEALRYHGEGTVIDLTEGHKRQSAARRDSAAGATAKSLTDDELEELWDWAEDNGMACSKMPYDGPGTGGFYCTDTEAVITGEGPGIPGGEPDLGGTPPALWAGGGGGSGSGGYSADPCIETDPDGIHFLCNPNPEVEEDKLCPKDPLKDMDIRATGCVAQGTRSVEGGRFEGRGGEHKGIDLLAEVGTSLFALNGGEIKRVGFDNDGWGNYVVIESPEGDRFFLYAHLSSVAVERGESVGAEDLIGQTGVSGNGTDHPQDPCSSGGPAHLHMEVREGSSAWYEAEPQDPEEHIGTEFNPDGIATSDKCT